MLEEADRARLTEMLDALDRDGYAMNPTWELAHDLAQEYEGTPEFDWLHALCHRIEGDTGNARYWYRRAGREPFAGAFRDEARAMLAELRRQ